MGNELKVFENEQFGNVCVIVEDAEPRFVGREVATILGYTNPMKAIRDHVDDEDKGVNDLFTPGGKQKVITINESGLYSLIISSKLPEAKSFKRWVTHDVLPSIRKHGAYAEEEVVDKMLADPDYAIKLFTTLKEERDKNKKLQATVETQAKKIETDKPKTKYYDDVLQSEGLFTVTQIASDYGISAQRLNKILAAHHVQYRQGRQWILYQKYAQLGWGKTKTYYRDKFNRYGKAFSGQLLCFYQTGRKGIFDILDGIGIHPIHEL